ncbi:SAM-dependent methyltransferase [Melittangium boletus]|uniref:SAM-dependent methyltransferase n=1 Tax=Melittangium boletus TaxID=83453 RepID=UPI003DA64ADF
MLGTASAMGKPYRPKDHYFKKAKQEGLRARSAFKVDEILKRHPFLKKGASVLDLGAAPGGFLQILADTVGANGRVIGVDIVPIRPFSQAFVKTAVLDVLADDFDAKLLAMYEGPFDAVISDMAPKTSGIRTTDEARSLRLARKALEVSLTRGRPGSAFVAKLFMGGEFEEFRDEVRAGFEEVKLVRPEATRGASMEVYIIGLRRRVAPAPAPA